MSKRLRELIKEVRQCKTASDERKVISKECAIIRTSFKEEENQYRKRNIAKLLFIHMMGYPTAFGQMECLRLIVSQSYGDKRMGYLGLMVLLDERQEVLMLVTNSLKNDLNHPNQYVVGLALCSLGNISSASIARDLSGEVIKLLGHSNAYIRKKANLCAIRIVRKVPELLDQFIPKVRPMLVERNHGVLITAISLMIEIIRVEPESVRAFKKTTVQLVKILKNLVSTGHVPEHDVNGVTDPFLQVKILTLLRFLGKGDSETSDHMNDILAQVATNTDGMRNVGNAILYECVQTIMNIESESGLRILAINLLGRFLMNRDNNIRYVALNTLTKVVHVDQQAVQRHRQTVVECLKDHDSSIRKRALDLTYALVNKSNIKVLVKELVNFLISADIEFRPEITAQICLLTERYAPSPKWHIDTILRVMSSRAGHYVQPATVANTIHLIQETPDIQAYAVHKFYAALLKDIACQSLVSTGVWVIGEFGDLLLAGGKDISIEEIFGLLDTILKHPASELETREITLTALLKLTDRLQSDHIQEKFLAIIEQYRSSLTVEIQQRACEYHSVVSMLSDEKRADLLEHIPAKEREEDVTDYDEDEEPVEEAPAHSEQASLISLDKAPEAPGVLTGILGGGPSAPAPSSGGSLIDILGGGNPAPVVTPAAPGGSLVELLGGPSPAPVLGLNPTPALGGLGAVPVGNSPAVVPSLLGTPSLLGVSPTTPSPVPTPVMPTPAPLAPAGGLAPLTVFEKGGIQIVFRFQKQPDQPQVTVIESVITNNTPIELTNFVLQYAVPGYMKILINPASGTVVPPNRGTITQFVKIANTMLGQQPSAMKLKLDFVANGRPVGDQFTITNFPAGV